MEDYKKRFLHEYAELTDRIIKLERMLIKYECGTLDFKPDSPRYVLQNQLDAMKKYLHCLILRAEYEKIDLRGLSE